MLTRCCWPPLNSIGLCLDRSASPIISSICIALLTRSLLLTPSKRRGKLTFSSAVKAGRRLYDWKIKPMYRLRNITIFFSLSLLKTTLRNMTSPLVGRSRPAEMFIKVVLPHPDVPKIAANSPCSRSNVTLSTAVTTLSPMRYFLIILRSSSIGISLSSGFFVEKVVLAFQSYFFNYENCRNQQ